MEDFLTKKIYIDTRYKTNTEQGNNANFQVMLNEVVNLPEKCVGYIDEIIMPILFFNVQEGVNDKLYFGIFIPGDNIEYFTLTLPEKNYNLVDLASELQTQFNEATSESENEFSFLVSAIEDTYKIIVQQQEHHAFNIFTDNDLANGLYNNTVINDPQSINNIIVNYKYDGTWSNWRFTFFPDLHPVRNLYLTCSELSNYSSLTNFSWGGKNIIKKIPVNVGFGGMLYLTQSLANDHFNCGNKSLSQLNFQLRNSEGNIVKLSSHWSFSIIFLRANE